jgi:hypothetical protein
MEFDDFFENKRKRPGNYSENSNHDHERYSHPAYPSTARHGEQFNWFTILEKIRKNNTLKVIAVLGAILVVAIAILLFIVFFPLIMKLLDYLNQHGLQGIADGITSFLDKLWKGSGK